MLHFRSEDKSLLHGRGIIYVDASLEYKVAKSIQDMQLICNMVVLVIQVWHEVIRRQGFSSN